MVWKYHGGNENSKKGKGKENKRKKAKTARDEVGKGGKKKTKKKGRQVREDRGGVVGVGSGRETYSAQSKRNKNSIKGFQGTTRQ